MIFPSSLPWLGPPLLFPLLDFIFHNHVLLGKSALSAALDVGFVCFFFFCLSLSTLSLICSLHTHKAHFLL